MSDGSAAPGCVTPSAHAVLTRFSFALEDANLPIRKRLFFTATPRHYDTISEHIKHIFEDGELEENSVVRFFRTTAADGKRATRFTFAALLLQLPWQYLVLEYSYHVRGDCCHVNRHRFR